VAQGLWPSGVPRRVVIDDGQDVFGSRRGATRSGRESRLPMALETQTRCPQVYPCRLRVGAAREGSVRSDPDRFLCADLLWELVRRRGRACWQGSGMCSADRPPPRPTGRNVRVGPRVAKPGRVGLSPVPGVRRDNFGRWSRGNRRERHHELIAAPPSDRAPCVLRVPHGEPRPSRRCAQVGVERR
jgi:hypothetical protein